MQTGWHHGMETLSAFLTLCKISPWKGRHEQVVDQAVESPLISDALTPPWYHCSKKMHFNVWQKNGPCGLRPVHKTGRKKLSLITFIYIMYIYIYIFVFFRQYHRNGCCRHDCSHCRSAWNRWFGVNSWRPPPLQIFMRTKMMMMKMMRGMKTECQTRANHLRGRNAYVLPGHLWSSQTTRWK